MVTGYFCDNTMDIVVLDNSTTVCPVGHYCPLGKCTASLISFRHTGDLAKNGT